MKNVFFSIVFLLVLLSSDTLKGFGTHAIIGIILIQVILFFVLKGDKTGSREQL